MTDRAAPPAASRWWAVSLATTVLVCVLLSAWTQSGVVPIAPGPTPAAVTAAIGAGYLVVFVVASRSVVPGSVLALVLLILTAGTAAALTAVSPVSATFQFWAYPMLWTLSRGRGEAVAWSAGTAVAVFGGFAVSAGGTDAWVQAAVVQAASLSVSIAMGMWITRIAEYGAERARLVDELTAAQGELAALHHDAGALAERERLSRELHDTIAQSLAGTVLLIQRARRELASGALADDTLAIIEDAGRAALTETRTLVAASAAVELSGGFDAALATVARRFERESGVRAVVRVDLAVPLARESEVALLRCAQEALANVRKHAEASGVSVTVVATAEEAVLTVVDDGRGFDADAVGDGFGLAGLRQRFALVGGRLDLDGSPGRATVTARVPSVVAG